MNVTSKDHSINIDGHTIEFSEKVGKVCLFKNCCVIMLEENIIPDNNIMAFDSNGTRLWVISDIIPYVDAYVSLSKTNENQITVRSYCGVRSTIDIEKCCVVKKEITK